MTVLNVITTIEIMIRIDIYIEVLPRQEEEEEEKEEMQHCPRIVPP